MTRHLALLALVGLLLAPPAAAQTQTARPEATAARVEPGDRLLVKFSRDVQLSDTVFVNESRTAVLPKLGPVDLSAMPVTSIRDSLRARYARFLRDPALDVVVLRRIIVNGDVMKPNVYLMDVTATLQDVLARAGGVSELGDSRRVEVIRDGVGRRIGDWERDRTIASELRSGDQVFVGRRSWISRNALQATGALGVVVSLFLALRSS